MVTVSRSELNFSMLAFDWLKQETIGLKIQTIKTKKRTSNKIVLVEIGENCEIFRSLENTKTQGKKNLLKRHLPTRTKISYTNTTIELDT